MLSFSDDFSLSIAYQSCQISRELCERFCHGERQLGDLYLDIPHRGGSLPRTKGR